MAAPPTGTSGATGWIPDILTIIQEACERASVDFTGAYTLRSAKRSLDLLTMSWANKGLNLWTLDEQTTPLSVGVPDYTLPADTVDLVFPTLRTTRGGVSRDTGLARQDFTGYASIVNKSDPGRPATVFVQRMTAQPKAYIWLVPDEDVYSLVWWRLRRMQNSGAATNSLDIPFRFVPAMTSGLAWQMALKKPVKDLLLITALEAMYDKDLLEAQREDHDRSDMYLHPAPVYED